VKRLPLLLAAAFACGGCNAIEWNFGISDDASTTQVGPNDASIAMQTPTEADAEQEGGCNEFTDAEALTWAPCADGGCPAPGLHCNASSGQCVPCLADTQCTDNKTLTVCDLNSNDSFAFLCVECVHDSDCDLGDTCLTNQCIQSCSATHDDCKASAANCDSVRDICVGCRQSGDCSKGEVCNVVTGRCGACTLDTDCPSFKPRCDPRTNLCERCLSSADCSGGVCDPQTQLCGSASTKMWDE